jgi:hydrogenase expression/formation protein HypC
VCVAIPSLVTGLHDVSATVECFGVAREVSLLLMSEPLAVGDYVLVRSGRYVVERIDRDSALDVLDVMGQLLREGEPGVPTEQRLGLAAAAGRA